MLDKRTLIPNSTQLPNVVVDALMSGMTGNELKVYLVIIRKTIGWHKLHDNISISQIGGLTGLKDTRSVKRILLSLSAKGLIAKTENIGKPNTLSALYQGVGENVGGENEGGGNKCMGGVVVNGGGTPYIFTPPQNKRKQTKQNKVRFLQFYSEYPNKKAKKDAEKAFMKLNMTDELFEQIIASLNKQKSSEVWIKNNGQFIPLPATWLRGERWNDELEPSQSENHGGF